MHLSNRTNNEVLSGFLTFFDSPFLATDRAVNFNRRAILKIREKCGFVAGHRVRMRESAEKGRSAAGYSQP